jgi:hypothetical protein
MIGGGRTRGFRVKICRQSEAIVDVVGEVAAKPCVTRANRAGMDIGARHDIVPIPGFQAPRDDGGQCTGGVDVHAGRGRPWLNSI